VRGKEEGDSSDYRFEAYLGCAPCRIKESTEQTGFHKLDYDVTLESGC
jgi:hypothetical protein